MKKITVFTKPACVQCNATKTKLDNAKVDYTLVDVTEEANASALALIKGWGYLTAPVVLVEREGEKDEHWGGFQPDKITQFAA